MSGGTVFLGLLLVVVGVTLVAVGSRRRGKAFIHELQRK